MKKTLLLHLLILVIFIAGCSNKQAPSDTLPSNIGSSPESVSDSAIPEQESKDNADIFEIKEKMFIAQCNDIYLNPEDYKNKTIKLEGIYDEYTDPETNKTYYYVIRYGPGCCGNDGTAGFEILYDGNAPKLNDWIEVMGTIEEMEDDGFEYVALRVSKLTILDVRGAESVSY